MKATLRGSDWGAVPIWTVEHEGGKTDVHAVDEPEAIAKAEAALAAATEESPPGLADAVKAVVSAPDFETAKANLVALIADS